MSEDLIVAPRVTGWGALTKALKTHWEPQFLFLQNTVTNNEYPQGKGENKMR